MDYACARPGRGQAAIFAYFTLVTSGRVTDPVWLDQDAGSLGHLREDETVEATQKGFRNPEENVVIAQAFKTRALHMLKRLQGVQLASWNLGMFQ